MIDTLDLSREYGSKLPATILVSLFIQFSSEPIYSNVMSTAAAVGVILLIGVVIDWLTRARVSRQAQLLEFEG